jgi:flagellar hook assembly protein FlgD
MNPGFTTGTSTFVGQVHEPNKGGLIKIFSEGKMVKEILIETEYSGIYPDVWDGKNASGKKVPAGNYHYSITKEGVEIENGAVVVE